MSTSATIGDNRLAAFVPDRGAGFEQAKKTGRQPQFLQIVAKQGRVVRKVEAKPEPKLTRVAFAVSRLMEFCNKREPQNQTGHSVHDWPLVVAKELFDNGLDGCEEAEVAPNITVIVEPNRIIVQDNANGIDNRTIESILDYSIRVSSREAYVSPTRGAQGNALKTILAMGYVLQAGAEAGITILETNGAAHHIEFRADHIDNQPKIIRATALSTITTGTRITIHWPAPDLLDEDRSRNSSGLTSGLIRTSRCAGPGSVASSSTWRRPIPIGKSGGRAIRRAPTGTTSSACSVILPRMWPETAIAARAAPCASSSPNFAGSPGPRASARSSTRLAARTNP